MPERELMEQLDQAIDALLAGGPIETGDDRELAAFIGTARALRDLPSESFKNRLKTEMERNALMMTSTSTGTRAGFRTITPFIIHSEAPALVDFLKTTFGAEELKRNTAAEAYGFYSEVRIGDTVIMIGGGTAAGRGDVPSALHVYVPDCDAAYRRALDAGAANLMGAMGEPADRPYGERSGFVQDAFGNYWYIATRLPSAPAPQASVLPYLHPANARQYMEFLKRAFGAVEKGIFEIGGRVMHALAGIGDAVLEFGEPEDRTGIPTNGFFLFVDDVEAAYARALAAGATEVRPPQDIPYGSRSAIVRDPEGYLWWTARWIG